MSRRFKLNRRTDRERVAYLEGRAAEADARFHAAQDTLAQAGRYRRAARHLLKIARENAARRSSGEGGR